MSENNEVLIDERGLPRYLDMQAGLGYTKHIGGSKATKELLELCEVNPEKVVLNVGSGAVGMNEPIYVKTPPPAAATLQTDYAGHEILPPSVWEDLLSDVGMTNIITKTYPVNLREESRSQLGFFSRGDMIGLMGSMLKVLFGSDPFARNLIKRAQSNPREFYDFLGYGLFISWKGK